MVSTRGTNATGDGPRPDRNDSQSSQGSALDEPFRRISRRIREKADRRTEQIEAEAIEGAGSDQENVTRPASRIPAAPKGMRAADRIDTKDTKLSLPTKLRGKSKDEQEVVTLSDSEDETIAEKEKEEKVSSRRRGSTEEEGTAKEVEAIMAMEVAEEKQEEQGIARRASTEEEGTGKPRRASSMARAASPARSPKRISRATAAAVRNENKSPAVLEIEDVAEPPRTPSTRASSRRRGASQVPAPTRRSTRAASVARTAIATLEIPDEEEELPNTARRSTRTPSRARAAVIEEKETEVVAKPRTRGRSVRSTTLAPQATPTRLTRGMRKAGLTTPGEKEDEPAKFEPLPDDDIVDLTKQPDMENECTENAVEAKETAEKVQETEEFVDVTEDEVFDPVAEDDESVKDGEEATKADEGPTKTPATEDTANEAATTPLKAADYSPIVFDEDDVIFEKYVSPNKPPIESVDLTGDDEHEKEQEEDVTAVTPVAQDATETEVILPTPKRQLNEAISNRLISDFFTPAHKKTPVTTVSCSRLSALSGATAVSTPIPGQGNSSFMDWEETGTPKVLTDTPIVHADPIPSADDFDDDEIQISYQHTIAPKEAEKVPEAKEDSKEGTDEGNKEEDDFEDFADMCKKPDVEDSNNGKDSFDDVEDSYAISHKKHTLVIGEEEAATPAGERMVLEVIAAAPEAVVAESSEATAVVEESSNMRQSLLELTEAEPLESVEAPEVVIPIKNLNEASEAVIIEASPHEEEPGATAESTSTANAESAVEESKEKTKENESIVLSDVPEDPVEVANALESIIDEVSDSTCVLKESMEQESLLELTEAEPLESVVAPKIFISTKDVIEASEPANIETSPQQEETATTNEAESTASAESVGEKSKGKTKEKECFVASEVAEEAMEVADALESIIDEVSDFTCVLKENKERESVLLPIVDESMESVDASVVITPIKDITEAPEAANSETSPQEEDPAVVTEATPTAIAVSIVEESEEKTKEKERVVASEVADEAMEVADIPVATVTEPSDAAFVAKESSNKRQPVLDHIETEPLESVEAPEVVIPIKNVTEASETVAIEERFQEEEPTTTTEAEPTANAESVKEKTKGKKSVVPSEVPQEPVEAAEALESPTKEPSDATFMAKEQLEDESLESLESLEATSTDSVVKASSATEEPTVPVVAEHTEFVVDEPLKEKTPKKKEGEKPVETEPPESAEASEVIISIKDVTEAAEPVNIETSPQEEEPAVTNEAEPTASTELVKEKTKKKKKGRKSVVPSEVPEEAVEVEAAVEVADALESTMDEPTDAAFMAKESKERESLLELVETTESVEAAEVCIPIKDVTEASEALNIVTSPQEEETATTIEAEPTANAEPVKEKQKKKKKGNKSVVSSEVAEDTVEVVNASEPTVDEHSDVKQQSILLPLVDESVESVEASVVISSIKEVTEAPEASNFETSSQEEVSAATTEAESTANAESVEEKPKKKKKGKKTVLQSVDTESIEASDAIADASAHQEETALAVTAEEPSVPTQDKKKKKKKRQAEAVSTIEEEKTEEPVVKEKKKKEKKKVPELEEVVESQPTEDLVIETNEEVPAKKTKKAKKRKAVKEEEEARKRVKLDDEVVVEEERKENIPEDEEVAKEKPKKKKKKTKGKKMVVAEEEDVEKQADSANDALKFPNITFKRMFHKPSTCCTEISSALAALYTWSCQQHRADDLPDVFVNDNEETVWQFVAHKDRQIAKDFRKYKDLLDEPIVLPGLEDDGDEEEGLSDLEMDDEEQDGMGEEDEEMAVDENIDLFNLRDEDLKDLERELHDVDDEDDEAGPSSKEPAPKKFKKSIVDDKFFSLAEMDAFCDEQENKNEDEGILATVDDSWGGPADYRYEEFFGKLDDVVGGEAPQKKLKPKKRKGEELVMKASKKKKRVRFALDEEDEGEDNEEEPMVEEKETPVLLGEKEEGEKPESKLKAYIRKLKESIRQLKQENLEPRSWELSGEVSAQQRAENTFLDTHMQVDNAAKRAPEVTKDFTERLEALIKQRVKDEVLLFSTAFDDVLRIKKGDEKAESYRNEAIEEMESMKKSLSEVYEKEYQKAAGQTEAAPVENEQHKAVQTRLDSLFQLIDAMSHYDYTPPQVRPEIKVVSNMAALRVEEVGLLASTDAQLRAPEEVKKRAKGDIKAGEERTSTDKLRQRRKKKIRQRAFVLTLGAETALAGQLEKKIQKKKVAGSGGKNDKDESMKSSNFFSKLQDTVSKEKKEKTKKKKKMVKSEKVSNGGAKFKL